MYFPVSGVEVSPLIPLAVSFVVSFFCSMGGLSGAFLILPFQMSVLGFTSPAVSSTNFVFNIIAIPSGVYRYIREGRMAWPLAWIIILGTLPGIFIGAAIRVSYLPDPKHFKVFMGFVLLYMALRLVLDLRAKTGQEKSKTEEVEKSFRERSARMLTAVAAGETRNPVIRTTRFSLTEYAYEFYGEKFSFNTMTLSSLAFAVGIVGGIYGVGGGAIIAPFLVAFFHLPIYTIAGATLFGTFLTSIAGALFYALIAPFYRDTGLMVAPDWMLGALFGVGGFLGMYFGARLQKYFPARLIKLILIFAILFLGVSYLLALAL
ncbi:MAG: sulfite exporter TauE/SafE family protein [Deltaproteobacteria bacterium]|jgi:hypothetical protein|nr:sulfite exporter TauE/SafE family protein [Deltaproteobacteria bacterium]